MTKCCSVISVLVLVTACCWCLGVVTVSASPVIVSRQLPANRDIWLGPCVWVVDRQCPDKDISFFLFTRQNPNDRQRIYFDDKANLSYTNFDPDVPTKIIIHGFNSDMFLTPLIDMKDEYLQRSTYNLFFVDYSVLAQGPCYISAVHNIKHVGTCVGQLVNRILETGTKDIHIIGFSLGGQVANYVAKSIKPFTLPRITGLDPALPFFVGVPISEKLDASDANFVDVFHTNALIQGKIEKCGHVDFYFNGGVIQPGCLNWKDNPAGCSHQRAPAYFMESIRSYQGFWGWGCSSYINYLLGFCPPTNYLVLAGEDCRPASRGMYLVKTSDRAPYALGKWTRDPFTKTSNGYITPFKRRDPLLEQIDQWGKLDGEFNNIDAFPTPFPQDPGQDWPYFNHMGSNQITNGFVDQGPQYHENSGYPGTQTNEVNNYGDGPYGIQVVDALHRKTLIPDANLNNSSTPLLIQKLYEDYNKRPAGLDSGYLPNRNALNSKYSDSFFSLPVLVTRNDGT